MPNDKKISKWKESLVRAGKRKSVFLWILISIFSGFGYFFINPFHDIQYFNKKQTFEPNFISTFYKGNNGFYIMENGKEAEAEKHGIIASKQRIKDFIQKMPEFQKNGSFSGEKMSKFLKNNKVNQYDVWRYAAQQVKNNLFFGAMEDFPSGHTKSINQSIVSQMNLQKISGMQFYLNDDFLEKRMKGEVDKLVKDKKALQQFLSDQFIESNFRVMTPEKRSGFLIQFPGNFKIERDILNKILVLHDRKKIERFLTKNKINYEITSLDSVRRDGSINNILFDSSRIIERGGSQFIPIVSEIIPIDFIALNKENIEFFQEEYKLIIMVKFLKRN